MECLRVLEDEDPALCVAWDLSLIHISNVIYGQLGEVHVSGHACQEEIKLLHALVKPKYFLPIHGAYSKLWQHAEPVSYTHLDVYKRQP